jgi:hypothetical protein
MTSLTMLLWISLIINGLFAGFCLDIATVKLPARKRIGSLAYANFARNNDLGNGLKVYPYFFIVSTLLSIINGVAGYINHYSESALVPLILGAFLSAGCIFCTTQAAPTMWSLKKTPNDEKLLTEKLDRFAFWHNCRTLFQVSTFLLMCYALAIL